MEAAWFKNYPKGTAQNLNISAIKNVGQSFKDVAQRFANHKAVSCMGSTLTYKDLDKLSDEFASFLTSNLKLKKGDRLAIMLPNILQFPVCVFGALKAGVICVNTNPLYTPREMKHQFKDSGATAIVILDMFADKLEGILPETDIKNVVITSMGDQLSLLKGWVVDLVLHIKKMIPRYNLSYTPFKTALRIGSQGPKVDCSLIAPEDIAFLQYTGGTTGVSKGAVLTHLNIMANSTQCWEWVKGLLKEGGDTALAALPLYHIFSLTINLFLMLMRGNFVVLLPKPIPIKNTSDQFKKHNISIFVGVNTLFNALCNDPNFKKISPKSLKVVIAGGMALHKSVAQKWQDITGCPIVQGYGLTECSPVTHVNPINEHAKTEAIGLPLPSTSSCVLDENDKEVAIGEVGELCIKGPQVMKGYWQRPDESARSLKNGWLHTGDMAKADENGFFYIVDRKKDMILVSGFNVYPNEVEEVIASHPKVLEVCVIGIPENSSGELVKAFIVPKDLSLTKEEIMDFCKSNLTNYKRPRQIEFRKELPKTNIGKILRRALKDEVASSLGKTA